MNHINKVLFQKNHITEKQYNFFESLRKEETISLYYELRLLLYMGILLFTGGIGYLVYENIGSVGHILMMTLLCGAIFTGLYYISKFAKPYANHLVTVQLVYFDYLLILVSLLIVGLFTYIQIYFELVAVLANWSSYISASILFYMGYRYDNRALLSMGITALAAALGFTVTPINWAIGEWASTNYTFISAILLGVALYFMGYISEERDLKKHFKFTYQNFGFISFYLGCISGIFTTNFEITYAVLTMVFATVTSFYTWKKREFLFFLYANISAYIAVSYLFFTGVTSIDNGYILMIYYFPVTSICYIAFLINKKTHFIHA